MELIVDTREQKDEILYLKKSGLKFTRKKLDCGDYKIVTDEGSAVVERKEMADLISSLFSKRWESQMKKLANEQNAILLVTGSVEEVLNKIPRTRITKNLVLGALASARVRYGISIIWISDGDCSHKTGLKIAIDILKKIAEHKLDKIPDEKVRDSDYCRGVIKILFGVPSNVATRLLEEFGSVWNVIHASEEELLKVKGMGLRRIEKSRKILGVVRG